MPFSVYDPGATDTVPVGGNQVLTGAIDCLAKVGDGRVRVLEFKTGPPRPEHTWQLEQYVAAARAMFPGMGVEGRLIYPSRRDPALDG